MSTDVEADGPIPGPHSMLSLASAAYFPDKTLVDTFTVNLETLPGAKPDPRTARWWKKHPEAWKACRRDPQPPREAMRRYVDWLEALPGKPVFVAYPAGFDFTFVYWYLHRFAGRNPFGWQALDIKTFAMAVLGTPFIATTKKAMPDQWFENLPFKHVALDDAIQQGVLFCNMLAHLRASRNES